MNIATTEPKINRRRLFAALPAFAATATGVMAYQMPEAPAQDDPLPEWWRKYQMVSEEFGVASRKDGNGNFDTPEMVEIEGRKERLEKLICETKPRTGRGAAAKLAFIDAEMREGLVWEGHNRVIADVISFLGEAV